MDVIDINECAEMSSLCLDNSYCLNTNGGYMCVCNAGYMTNTGGTGCCKLYIINISSFRMEYQYILHQRWEIFTTEGATFTVFHKEVWNINFDIIIYHFKLWILQYL